MNSVIYAQEVNPKNARKRVKLTTLREKQKMQRYRMHKPPKLPNCVHVSGRFKCSSVSEEDAQSFAEGFYSSNKKIVQDCFLLKYCDGYAPERIRRNGGPERGINIDYSLRKANGKAIKICKKAFYRILHVSEFRVKRICKEHLKLGKMPVEKRGGDRKSKVFLNRKSAIIAFIKKFKVLEIHYCRTKIKHRQYLPSELNINKISNMYNNQAKSELKVKTSYFRKVFNTKFNIGFKAPCTDMCSVCIMYDEQIKFAKDASTKNKLMARKQAHKKRSKEFYDLLKEKSPDTVKMSFDCQKNQVLPKVPDQSAYFSRQLYQYNFGIVEGSSKSRLTKANVFLYRWTENLRPKGSNEIASALFHRLNNTRYTKKGKIRLIADGCGGQNKNSIVLGMCAYWLQLKSPKNIKQIEIVFPVVGHSFLPPDRVFAMIEREVKDQQTIIVPSEYTTIFEKYGTSVELGGVDCPVYDWKAETKKCLKTPAQMHFQFNGSKRFILRKSRNNIEVSGESLYMADKGDFDTINKKGKQISDMKPEKIKIGVIDKQLKMQDIYKLLKKHFGSNWMDMPNLEFYKKWMNTMDDEALAKLKAMKSDDDLEEDYDDEEQEETCDDPICECYHSEND